MGTYNIGKKPNEIKYITQVGKNVQIQNKENGESFIIVLPILTEIEMNYDDDDKNNNRSLKYHIYI